jgi:hypothetical protein
MASIRWIRNILVDGRPRTIEIMIGSAHISDKCYVRIDNDPESYFTPFDDTREGVVAAGIEILREALGASELQLPDGRPFLWE